MSLRWGSYGLTIPTFSLLSFRIYFGIFFPLLTPLQQILKQVQDDGLRVRGLADIRSNFTDGCLPHTTNTSSHLPARTRNSGLPADDLHTWSGGEATTQNSPIFFPWEIKTKDNFIPSTSPKPKTPILRLHKTNVACFFVFPSCQNLAGRVQKS